MSQGTSSQDWAMQRLEMEQQTTAQWHAGTELPPIAEHAAATVLAPEVEDARRRFILALRAMTARKERDEQQAEAIRGWMRVLEADVAAYRRIKARKTRRQLFAWAVVVSVVFGHNLPIFREFGNWWWILLFVAGGKAAADAFDPKRSSELAGRLATSRDPRAVSVLAVAARDGDPDTKLSAERGLNSILPQLRASDAEHITDDGMNALLTLLGRTPSPRFQVVILRALEQVGDHRAFSMVDMLASTGDTAEIRDSAKSCLKFLRLREEQSRLRHTLLRPATDPIPPNQSLLRPAGPTDTPSEELLRPAES